MGGGSGDTSLGVREVECCQRAPAVPPGTAPHIYPLQKRQERVCLQEGLEKVSSPEEGVMFYADLPETLGGAVVGQLEANGAFKLFVLGGDRDTPLQADPALEDVMGWDLPRQGPQVPLTGAMAMPKMSFSKQHRKGPCPAPLGGAITLLTLLA